MCTPAIRSLMLTHPLASAVNGSLISLPSPRNIRAMWTFGSLLGLCLATQILTGLFLAFQFTAESTISFELTLEFTQTVNMGWLLRILHANGARVFFICLYLHTGRGLYYSSYTFKETWGIGVVILLAVIGAAFLGYVLPWGQMSFWGATVITSLITAIPYIGTEIVLWLWGGYSVDNRTLTRFFALHFLIPFVVAALVIAHFIFLHETGSSNPLGLRLRASKVALYPYFLLKDSIGFAILLGGLTIVVIWAPWAAGDPENFIPANPLMAPVHIQPEWYFLFAYAILRSIPNKLGGVIALALSIIILLLPSYLPLGTKKGALSYPVNQVIFWALVGIVAMLTWIGACPVEAPYVTMGQGLTVLYFGFYFTDFLVKQASDWLVRKNISSA